MPKLVYVLGIKGPSPRVYIEPVRKNSHVILASHDLDDAEALLTIAELMAKYPPPPYDPREGYKK